MEIKFDIKMTHKIMYDFLMTHTYKSPAGVIGTVFGVFALVLLAVTWGDVPQWQSMLYLVFGIWFLLYLPINLWFRSGRQLKTNPVFKKPLTYVMNQEGITTMQEDQKATIAWSDIYKVMETKLSLLVYTGKRTSFVLPKESMGTQYGAVIEMLRTSLDKNKVKVK